MDDIAKKLGMSKKTLYKFFPNKKELVLDIMKSKIANSENECSCHCHDAKDAIHEIILIMEMLKKTFQNTNPAMLYDLQKYHHDAWKLMEKHESEFIFNMMVDNLKRGIAAGLYRDKLKIDILVRMRLGVMRMSFSPEFNPDNKYSMEELQIALLNHFLIGITTIKGYKIAEEYKKNLLNSDEN